MLRRLVVDLGELDEFKHFDATFARFAFREERMCSAHTGGNLSLCQPCLFASRNQLLKKAVVESLVLRRPALAGYASLRLPLFLHLFSVEKA